MTAPTPAFLSQALSPDPGKKMGMPSITLTEPMLRELGDLAGLAFSPDSLTPVTNFGQWWDTVLGKLSGIVKDIFSLSYQENTEKTPPAWVTYGGMLCGLVLSYLDQLPSQIQRDLSSLKTAHTRLLRQVSLVESKPAGQHLLPILDGLYSASKLHEAELLVSNAPVMVGYVALRQSADGNMLGIYKSILKDLSILDHAFLATKETPKNKSVLRDISNSTAALSKEIKRLILKSAVQKQTPRMHAGDIPAIPPDVGPGEGGEVSWGVPDPLKPFVDDRTIMYMISISWAVTTSTRLSEMVTQMTECIRTLTTYHDILGRCVAQLLQQYQYIWFEDSGYLNSSSKKSVERDYTEQLLNDRSLLEALQNANVTPSLSSSIMTTEVLNQTLQSQQDSFKSYLSTARDALNSETIADDLAKIKNVLAQTPNTISSSWVELAWKDLSGLNETITRLQECLDILDEISDSPTSTAVSLPA